MGMPVPVGPSIGKSLGSGAMSVFKVRLRQAMASLWLRKPFVISIKNSVKQTRKHRLFSLNDWLVSPWNLPALFPPSHPMLGLQIHSAVPSFHAGSGDVNLSSHFLHSKHSTR